MIRRLRRLARTAIVRWERLLHPVRRHRARRALTRSPAPQSVLLVCLGNICRSPYAALRLRAELLGNGAPAVDVASAGLIEAGRPSPETARRVAARRGVDLDPHRSRLLTAEMLRSADAVLVMSPGQRREVRLELGGTGPDRVLLLGDLDPGPIDRRTILDPVEKSEEVFEAVFERIDRCCRALAAILAAAARG